MPGVCETEVCWDSLRYLEDHPMTCKWLITMVIVSPPTGVVGPLPNGLSMGLTN